MWIPLDIFEEVSYSLTNLDILNLSLTCKRIHSRGLFNFNVEAFHSICITNSISTMRIFPHAVLGDEDIEIGIRHCMLRGNIEMIGIILEHRRTCGVGRRRTNEVGRSPSSYYVSPSSYFIKPSSYFDYTQLYNSIVLDYKYIFMRNSSLSSEIIKFNLLYSYSFNEFNLLCDASSVGDVKLVKYLMKRVDPSSSDNTPLRYASYSKRDEIVRLLLLDNRVVPPEDLQLDMSLDESYSTIHNILQGYNSIRYSSSEGLFQVAILEYLNIRSLETLSYIDPVVIRRLLYYASLSSYLETVKILIQHPRIGDLNEFLYYACTSKKLLMVRVFIDSGKIDFRDRRCIEYASKNRLTLLHKILTT